MTIQEYLDERGVPRKSIGYAYIYDMVSECIRSPTMPYHLNRFIEQYATKNNLKSANIERTMRYAIKKNNPNVSLCEFIIEAGIQLRKKEDK